jgi:hypothetical protein
MGLIRKLLTTATIVCGLSPIGSEIVINRIYAEEHKRIPQHLYKSEWKTIEVAEKIQSCTAVGFYLLLFPTILSYFPCPGSTYTNYVDPYQDRNWDQTIDTNKQDNNISR